MKYLHKNRVFVGLLKDEGAHTVNINFGNGWFYNEMRNLIESESDEEFTFIVENIAMEIFGGFIFGLSAKDDERLHVFHGMIREWAAQWKKAYRSVYHTFERCNKQ